MESLCRGTADVIRQAVENVMGLLDQSPRERNDLRTGGSNFTGLYRNYNDAETFISFDFQRGLNMRMLLKAIIANLNHYNESIELEFVFNSLELAEVIGIEADSERMAEIEKLAKELRVNLGESSTKAGRLLELLLPRGID